MRFSLLIATIAVVGVPIAVSGQGVNEIRNSNHRDESARRTCRVEQKSGTRIGRVSRCTTRQEDANNKEDSRRTVERVQAMRFAY
jgi:hypothetical protein